MPRGHRTRDELLHTYASTNRGEPLHKFLTGEPDDYAWFVGWETVVRDATAIPYAEYAAATTRP